MLHPDFKNGEKLDLHYALALFTVLMGFLFYVDAAPGAHTLISGLTILAGLLWVSIHYIWTNGKILHRP